MFKTNIPHLPVKIAIKNIVELLCCVNYQLSLCHYFVSLGIYDCPGVPSAPHCSTLALNLYQLLPHKPADGH